ncbi:MAG: hypothetical protein M1812_002550 [Candelaria pacifica]|nr:MAG: hypothetical protein M1812_002550 [Candelaria pacifica]
MPRGGTENLPSSDNVVEPGQTVAHGVPDDPSKEASLNSSVDRSYKAAPMPDKDDGVHPTTSGGSVGIKGSTGSGKGPKDPSQINAERFVDRS